VSEHKYRVGQAVEFFPDRGVEHTAKGQFKVSALAMRLSGRLLDIAQRCLQRHVRWAVVWLSEGCAVLAKRLLTER